MTKDEINYLRKEIEITKQLSHDNIIKFEGLQVTPNNFYLIFELCKGGSLQDMINFDKKIPEKYAKDIIL